MTEVLFVVNNPMLIDCETYDLNVNIDTNDTFINEEEEPIFFNSFQIYNLYSKCQFNIYINFLDYNKIISNETIILLLQHKLFLFVDKKKDVPITVFQCIEALVNIDYVPKQTKKLINFIQIDGRIYKPIFME